MCPFRPSLHQNRERFAARAEGCILRKDEVASREERPRVQRPAPLLIAESACRRSARVGFSRGKDACALLSLPFTVKAKLFQNPHLSRSYSTPLTELCYVAATQAKKARPSGSGGSPRGVAASASPLAQPPEMF